MTLMEIDLNSDLGEGSAFDEQLMRLITSANIACGFHAGDAVTAQATLATAARHGVHAGAHPGFPDREHFGRRELARSEDEIFADTLYQVGALLALARAAGQTLWHIKPHGALYNWLAVMMLTPGPWCVRRNIFRCRFWGFPARGWRRFRPANAASWPRASPTAAIYRTARWCRGTVQTP